MGTLELRARLVTINAPPPGEAVLMILPGAEMFQAQYLVQQRCRPAILHGYGGGKHAMPSSLTTLAGQGWVPLATAMVGKPERPPAWYGEDLRLVVGTSVDCRVLPTPLSEQVRTIAADPMAKNPTQ